MAKGASLLTVFGEFLFAIDADPTDADTLVVDVSAALDICVCDWADGLRGIFVVDNIVAMPSPNKKNISSIRYKD